MNARFASIRSAIGATLLFGAGLAAAGPTYTLTNLGTFGGDFSWGSGINELGQATGSALDSSGNSRAFLWDGGTMRNLGTLSWGSSGGSAINDAGQVTGGALGAWPATRAFVYRDGAMVELGTLGGAWSWGSGINNAGQVTGSAETARGDQHAFVYSGGVMRDLGTLGGDYSFGSAINASGQVTGATSVVGGGVHAFRSDGGVLTDLGTLGAFDGWLSLGYGINDAGDVAGWATYDVLDLRHAFLYHDGRMEDLGALSGATSGATDVNNHGDVVGWSDTSSGQHGFVYSDGVMTDLNDLLPPDQRGEWTITDANGINDSGQIIAFAVDSNGFGRAVILTPTIPEPSTAALLAVGLGTVVWARRRKLSRA